MFPVVVIVVWVAHSGGVPAADGVAVAGAAVAEDSVVLEEEALVAVEQVGNGEILLCLDDQVKIFGNS